MIGVIYTSYLSLKSYLTMLRQCELYKKLEQFAIRAEENLNGTYEHIRIILSDILSIPNDTNITSSLLYSVGFSANISQELMDYIIKYSYLNIIELRKVAVKFSEYASLEYKTIKEEYRKKAPALLCPPVCVFIILIILV